jgi:TrmH family RNA methyltransferase
MYISDKRIDNFADIISMSKTTVYRLTDSQAEVLSDTKNGSGLFARIEFKTRPIENYKKLIYLNAISDPGNIGTILRCGRAFGVDGIVLDKSCCDLTNPKVVRSSLGAVFTVPTVVVDEDWLSSRSEQLILSDLRGGVAIDRFEFPSVPYIVVFGSEAVGISDEIQKLSHTFVHIPVANEMESLNVGVAVGIFLHKMR